MKQAIQDLSVATIAGVEQADALDAQGNAPNDLGVRIAERMRNSKTEWRNSQERFMERIWQMVLVETEVSLNTNKSFRMQNSSSENLREESDPP
jgi:hypothetical protein